MAATAGVLTGPVTALVEYQIRTENNSMDEWLEVWGHRGQDALEGEPETTAYEAAVSLGNPENVLVFERYANGSSSLEKHTERDAHKALMAAMGERNMTKRRVMSNLFTDVDDYGWWGRPERQAVLRASGHILTILGMRFTTPGDQARFLAITQRHGTYCWDAEPDTLVYSGGLAVRDGDRGPDIKANDLVFVMACTDMDAVEKHQLDPKHLAVGEQLQKERVGVEVTYTQSYRTTGKGFLWGKFDSLS